jgi:hypothetical protein
MKSDTSKRTLELFYKEIDKKFWEKVRKEKELYFKNKKGR